MHLSIRAACVALLAACLAAGCASMDGQHDWWAVRATGNEDARQLASTSHVNHGKPPADGDLEPRLLREATRGQVSIALHHDAALSADWSGSAWKFTRELDKALDWLQRLAGPRGARMVVTLVDDAHARDIERTHAGATPTVDLVVAVPPDAPSQSAAVGRALAKALHETAHALAATSGDASADRFAAEYAAALVESCYLLDTLRPGDVVALNVAGRHAPTDNYAIEQSRAAAGTVVRELRALARADKLQADDADVQAALHARCDIER
ncbi:MAG TPA: hypothetical protein VFS99_09275 [Xanthomonadaceae bacterium]|nr:hypothetical protein [Xanthomonadaceae bacterium]